MKVILCADYVYFENSSSNPYLIRRIEELNKTANGNVEAKVVCFYRRRDISNSLIMLADKHASIKEIIYPGSMMPYGMGHPFDQMSWLCHHPDSLCPLSLIAEEVEEESETTIEVDLTDKQKHQLKHRELFLSRQYESLPATHIRGKCSVALLNETESVLSYLEKEDTFFYSLVYDPSLKTLLADKGEIRVGPRYQADVPDMLAEGELDDREQAKLEVKVWDPDSPLTDRQIDQFLVVARAVGTFARALDCSSSVRQPSLHMSAAAASRDITLFHAMDTLHKHNYDLSSAISVLVPLGGPVLCRDEMEEWSASEASLFEEALEKYGKDFNDIRQDFLPWKSLTSIIEYYYMWKTTDRYVQQAENKFYVVEFNTKRKESQLWKACGSVKQRKRLKAAEAESKLKQVYIPTYNKPNPNQISSNNGKPAAVNGAMGASYQAQASVIGRACESCYKIHPAVKPTVIRSTPSLQSPSAKRLLAPSNHSSLSILGKRNYSHHNGLDESSSHTTRTIMHAAPHIHMTNGKALQASASAIKTSTIPVIKRQRQNWLDASEDGFFIATEETRFKIFVVMDE
ncbi:metastasis associated 1 family member 3 [Willisornis vidua]|uniref:Metastasis associated 1 family member 3 n=1 Tax=Willisornis vidua TaxID=1566151 RepID=A0ABQ9DML1_9PASS|nr:metastasis associated 1 family member 3 [Willisornis vidua]